MTTITFTTTNGQSNYTWTPGGFLTLHEFIGAVTMGTLDAGVSIMGITVKEG